MISKWPDEAECRYEVYNPVTLFSLWPHRTIFAFSQLFSSELLQTMNARTDPCISSQSPLLLLAMIWALFDLQDLGMLFSYSGFFFRPLSCSNWGCCISQRNMPPSRGCHQLVTPFKGMRTEKWKERNTSVYQTLYLYLVRVIILIPMVWSFNIANLLNACMHK